MLSYQSSALNAGPMCVFYLKKMATDEYEKFPLFLLLATPSGTIFQVAIY